jgi:hypothetical protein
LFQANAGKKLVPGSWNFRDRAKLEVCSFFKSIAVIGLQVFLLVAGDAHSAQYTTNYELLTSMTDSLITEIAMAIPASVNRVTLRDWKGEDGSDIPSGWTHPASWFLENRLTEILKARHFEVFLNDEYLQPGQPADSSAVVDFRLLDIGIEYGNSREGLVLRKAHVSLLGRLMVSATGRIAYNGTLQANKSDWVTLADKQLYENPNIEFTIGKAVQTRGGGILQPLIVTVVTGVVVYLFYALRSR